MADGYASKYHPIIDHIKSTLPEWKILADPCFINLFRLHNNNSNIPELTPECYDKRIEFGIDGIAKANQLRSGQSLTYLCFYFSMHSIIQNQYGK